ncbi:MAG: GNAT family N-acetyltransferase [Kiritimatiellae bacterium]|nr:GNAT family N-acetyltransferase [Kiritimatiellia bacterium]
MSHSSELRIRPATPDDVPLILAFIRQIAEFEKLSHRVTATEEDLRESLFGANPGAEVLLAFAGDAPAAYAVFFHSFSTFLGKRGIWIEDIFVKPEFRRRGIGEALLTHIAALANARHCGRLEWTVLDWNTNAIAFYKALGADVLPDWKICRMTGPALRALAKRKPE